MITMKPRTRVFWIMAGILATTTIVFMLFLGGMMRFAFQPHERLRPLVLLNLKHYTDGLISEMGVPPKREVARELTGRLGIDLQIDGPGGYRYESEEGLPSSDALQAKLDFGNWGHSAHGISIGRFRGRSYLIQEKGDYRYVFSFSREVMGWMRFEVLLLIGGAIGVILLGTFFSMNLLQKLTRAKERLLLDVSHELRSPLARIQVALSMMDGPKVPASVSEGIKEDVRELDRLLSQTLEAARLEDGNPGSRLVVFDLRGVIRELKPSFLAASKIDWPESVLTGQDSFHVAGNPDQIRIALRNLIENAVKYSEGSQRPIEVSLEKTSGKKIEVRVKDYGVGIPKQERKKIFAPFYRTDTSRTRETGGYGLGLSLALRMIKANGGSLTLDSKESGESGPPTCFKAVFKSA
jgi:signal transduction histidine kinase